MLSTAHKFCFHGILLFSLHSIKMNSSEENEDEQQQQSQVEALGAANSQESQDLDALGDDSDADEDDESLPYILRSYFKIVGKIVDGKATGKCVLCPSTQKTFSGTLRVTTNLSAHLVGLWRSVY